MRTLVDRLRGKWARSKGRERATRRLPEGKEAFRRRLGRRLEDLDRDITLLRMAASRTVPKEEVEFLERLSDLRERTGRLQRALRVYDSEEGEAWRSFRSKAEVRWMELHRELTDAFEWYRERHRRSRRRLGDATEPGIELPQASPTAESEIGSP
jgi:hypothetical protein